MTKVEVKKLRKWNKGVLLAIPFYDPFEEKGDCRFDMKAAKKILSFYPGTLCHLEGPKAGKPFHLARWEEAILANLFGWKRKDGTRRFREAFIEVPRKNGKTALLAGIVLYGLLCDGEARAQIYSAAADRDQAKLVFHAVKGQCLGSNQLTERTTIYQNSIVARDHETGLETGSFYKPISAEANTKHGYNSHIVVVDELHAQPNNELVDVLETSTGSRAQPLLIHITTSDFDRDSICNEKESYAYQVRGYDQFGKKTNRIKDNSYLPAIWQANKNDDWRKFKTWKKANPCLGNSLSVEYIRGKCNKAEAMPRFLNTFLRLHLNIKTQTMERWIDFDLWDKCDSPFEENDLVGKKCFVGVDLASVSDTASMCYVFPPDDEVGIWRLIWRFYIPKENAYKREQLDNVPYLTWERLGYIKLTEGNRIDYTVIKADLLFDYRRFDVQEVAFDRFNFDYLLQELVQEGMPIKKFVEYGMGFKSLSAPTKKVDELYAKQLMSHNKNPIARWQAGNAVIAEDAAENWKPDKKKSTERIDGMVALVMAMGRAITVPEPKKSVYEDRDMRTL